MHTLRLTVFYSAYQGFPDVRKYHKAFKIEMIEYCHPQAMTQVTKWER